MLRAALWKAGLRYRKNDSTLPGKPDLVFRRPRVAVFCDGDFWHGRQWLERKRKLQRGHNPDYWIAKIEGNMERDTAVADALVDAGWIVVRVWESDIKSDVNKVVKRIRTAIETRG
ncbi:MAG: very short patch repair endonuclease [Candidatus Thiodiazotropha sp. (ex Dulcina madagascariensis)]|nr:very short patch repair endonuclease [Candidatus Thiodiazotropha sp. (ex Dulcina madagascariensis)]